jgi:hypothetical protein
MSKTRFQYEDRASGMMAGTNDTELQQVRRVAWVRASAG